MINRGKGAVRAPYWTASVPPIDVSVVSGMSEQEHQLTSPRTLVGCILHALNVCIVAIVMVSSFF